MPRRIDISYKTIIFIATFILGLWITLQILDLLLLLFVAVILMSALSPVVVFFNRFKVPKALGILITYIIIISVLAGVLASFVPALIEQTNRLISALPPMVTEQLRINNLDQSIIQTELAQGVRNVFSFALTVFGNFVTLIFLLVVTFYLLLERERLEARIAALFIGQEERIKKLTFKIEEKLGAWLRGQLFLSIIIGCLTYIGLVILGLPYSLPLALLAAVMEVVPVIGPIIAAIPAILIALTLSPALAAGVAAVYFVIQQLENHLIVPQVMKRAVGLNPLVVILAIAVGGRLLGITGALLAVPFAVVLQVIVSEVLHGKKD